MMPGNPIEQFREAIQAAGLVPPETIEADGKLRRFASNGRRNDDAGWYLLHVDGIPAGSFGDWRMSLTQSWRAHLGRDLTPAEEAEHRAKVEAMRREREAEEARRQAEAAATAAVILKEATPATDKHAYLIRKGIKANGALLHQGKLVIPMRSGGKVHSLQFIGTDGEKRFLTGGRVTGCYFSIGSARDATALCIVEGFATGASIQEATGYPVAVAFNAGNLLPVAKALREKFPDLPLILCADDDSRTEGNPGLMKANEAAKAINGRLIVPDFGPDRPDGASDFNDLARLRGDDVVRRAFLAGTWPGEGLDIAGCLSTPAPPVRWFITERMPAGRAGLLAAVGGSSKTRTLFHLAVGACIGRLPWPWEVATTGRAVLLLAEDTAADAHHALSLIGRMLMRDERRLVAERLTVYPLAGEDARLLRLAAGNVLIPTERAADLLRRLRMTRDLAFIGLDPALALTDGDELNPAHQRRLGELVDRLAIDTGACVLLSAHAAKGSQALDEPGSHTARGSGSLTDCVRFEFVLRTMTPPEARQFGITDIAERKAHVQLLATKGNALPPASFAPLWLRRGIGGALEPAALERQEAGAVGPREVAALGMLRELCRESTPSLKDWRDACGNAGLLSGKTPRARESSMERIRNTLRGAGLIVPGIVRGIFTPAEGEE